MKEANTSKHTAPARGRRLRRALLLALLAAVLAAGGLAFLFHREITGGGAAGRTVTVTVEQGSGVAAIAADLQQAGVIRFPRLFRWYVGRQGAAGRLQYGTFEVEQGASYDALIEAPVGLCRRRHHPPDLPRRDHRHRHGPEDGAGRPVHRRSLPWTRRTTAASTSLPSGSMCPRRRPAAS